MQSSNIVVKEEVLSANSSRISPKLAMTNIKHEISDEASYAFINKTSVHGDNSPKINVELESFDVDSRTIGVTPEAVDAGPHNASLSVYNCGTCGRDFDNENEFQHHAATHKQTVLFPCKICRICFELEDILRNQILVFHSPESSHRGTKMLRHLGCEEECKQNDHLKEYRIINDATVKQSLKFRCKFCELCFSEEAALHTHLINCSASKTENVFPQMEKHESNACRDEFTQKPIRRDAVTCQQSMYKCELCGILFARDDILQKHILNRHRILLLRTRHKCPECCEFFSCKDTLKKHLIKHKTSDVIFRCDICSYICKKKSNLNSHTCVPSTAKPFKCHICSAAFKCKTGLQGHMRTHTLEKPYVCVVCGAKYATSGGLQYHSFTHSEESPVICHDCGKTFGNKMLLTTHVRIHTGEKPHKCDVCGHAFFTRSLLVNHYRVHTGEKPFKCYKCDATYALRNSLRGHLLTHVKRFKCLVCGAAFSKKRLLESHSFIHWREKTI